MWQASTVGRLLRCSQTLLISRRIPMSEKNCPVCGQILARSEERDPSAGGVRGGGSF